MRVNGYQCDTCQKIECSQDETIPADIRPAGWLVLALTDDDGRNTRKLHFCSLRHLYQWTSNELDVKDTGQ